MKVKFNPRRWFTPNTYGANYADLPDTSGIYLFVRTTVYPALKFKILYIGMSKNIHKRCKTHDVKIICDEKLNPMESVQTYFKPYPIFKLREIEKHLIKRYNPSYNLQHRTKGI